MKLIIDIPEEMYNNYKEYVTLNNDAGFPTLGHLYEIIGVGTPIPDNATNGDVIKIVTGEFYWEIVDEYGNHCMTDVDGNRFDMDWWNAPYKGENNAE